MLTDVMATLGETKPPLETTVVVVFIANEENSRFISNSALPNSILSMNSILIMLY